jgi:hypothetical protein
MNEIFEFVVLLKKNNKFKNSSFDFRFCEKGKKIEKTKNVS